jgi:hypothetical protein
MKTDPLVSYEISAYLLDCSGLDKERMGWVVLHRSRCEG